MPYSPQQARRLWAQPPSSCVWHPCADSLLSCGFSVVPRRRGRGQICGVPALLRVRVLSTFFCLCCCVGLPPTQPPSSTAPTQWQPRHQAHESNDVRGGALRRLPVAQVRPTALWHRTLQLADTPSYCGLQGDILVAGAREWTLRTHLCSLGGATHVTDGVWLRCFAYTGDNPGATHSDRERGRKPHFRLAQLHMVRSHVSHVLDGSFRPTDPHVPSSVCRSFHPVANAADMTDVVFTLRFASSSPLHGPILETFFGEVAQRQIGAFQQRCSRVWGRGARRHKLPTPLTGNSKV